MADGLDPERYASVTSSSPIQVVQHDFGLLTDGGCAISGHVPFIEPTERLGYPVDPAVIDRVKHRLDTEFALAPLSTAAGGGGRLSHALHAPSCR